MPPGTTISTSADSTLPRFRLFFGNCGTIISFRVGSTDANALVREFAASGEGPRLTDQMYDVVVPASELQNLPDYKLYIQTLLDGCPQEPYLVSSYPPFQKSGGEAKGTGSNGYDEGSAESCRRSVAFTHVSLCAHLTKRPVRTLALEKSDVMSQILR
jgi:hypothetical protein